MNIAVLSNINVDPVCRQLMASHGVDVFDSPGYGNEIGILINKTSPLYEFSPDLIFVIVDVMELIKHNIDVSNAGVMIDEWFSLMEKALSDEVTVLISDAYLFGFEMGVICNQSIRTSIENKWNTNLYNMIKCHSNVRVFPFNSVIRKLGENNAFSAIMWYMGKILYSSTLQKALADEILHMIELEVRQPKKVLIVDLDNTLWRGLAGENDNTPITLADDGVGLAYKNFQRTIKHLKNQGVVLGIVSKNNEEDAMSILSGHPHMVLRPDDFAIYRINWESKIDNIVSIAEELNVGLDSIVFIDDSKVEQALIEEALPDVFVPSFPDRPEELVGFITDLYHKYFEKAVITDEDKSKTCHYQSNRDRAKLKKASLNFDEYLEGLDIKMYKVDPIKNIDRFIQLINKTNQFNLTTKRYTEKELLKVLRGDCSEAFLYRVTDKYGDDGIVAAAIVEYGKEAVIVEFTMSCRVMGRKIEYAVIEDIEESVRTRGYSELIGIYKPTEKNKPVKDLYNSFGYKTRKLYDDGMSEYSIALEKGLTRKHYVERIRD